MKIKIFHKVWDLKPAFTLIIMMADVFLGCGLIGFVVILPHMKLVWAFIYILMVISYVALHEIKEVNENPDEL